MKIFIDESGWFALLDETNPHHMKMQKAFKEFLEGNHRFYTTNVIVGNVISKLKESQGTREALRIYEIIEEAWLGTYLHVLWIGRRTFRDALKMFAKFPESNFSLFDFANILLMNRRNIRFILTIKKGYDDFGFKILPEQESEECD